MSRRFEVLLHDQPVGFLSEAADGSIEFRLLDDYRNRVPRPVLGQKFEDNPAKVHRGRKRGSLPDFFANLIPEGRLRELIEQGARIASGDDLGLLAYVGRDLPGAVAVRSEEAEPPVQWNGSGEEADDASAEVADEGAAETLRFSLAGVQLKFSMLRQGEKLTLPASGAGGEWIVKFDSSTYPRLPENEFAMLEWARAAGFDVPKCYLQDLSDVLAYPRRFVPKGSRVLVIRRYDRMPEGRVHQEDLAQVIGFPPELKYDHVTYEAMAKLVRRILDEDAVDELIRRLILVLACGNNDAHLKNWSLIYPDRIRPRWAPVYDQVATVAWDEPDRTLALKFAGVKDFARFDLAATARFAERAEIPASRLERLVTGTLDALREAWHRAEIGKRLPESHASAVREHWSRVPVLRDGGTLADEPSSK